MVEKTFYCFDPDPWGDDPILTSIFFRWVETKPPTRYLVNILNVQSSCWRFLNLP